MPSINEISTAIVTFLTGGGLAFLVTWALTRSRCQIIAVFGVQIPEEFKGIPVYSSYAKAKRCKYEVCVLITRTLSFGLRKCDFVVTDGGLDPKIVHPDDHTRLESLVNYNDARDVSHL